MAESKARLRGHWNFDLSVQSACLDVWIRRRRHSTTLRPPASGAGRYSRTVGCIIQATAIFRFAVWNIGPRVCNAIQVEDRIMSAVSLCCLAALFMLPDCSYF